MQRPVRVWFAALLLCGIDPVCFMRRNPRCRRLYVVVCVLGVLVCHRERDKRVGVVGRFCCVFARSAAGRRVGERGWVICSVFFRRFFVVPFVETSRSGFIALGFSIRWREEGGEGGGICTRCATVLLWFGGFWMGRAADSPPPPTLRCLEEHRRVRWVDGWMGVVVDGVAVVGLPVKAQGAACLYPPCPPHIQGSSTYSRPSVFFFISFFYTRINNIRNWGSFGWVGGGWVDGRAGAEVKLSPVSHLTFLV